MPYKPDTTAAAQENSNTLKMYDNMINKYKYGNFKNARYLDHESLNLFYPLITRLYATLADNLLKEGHQDLAKNALKKYDDVMPAVIISTELAVRKYYMAESLFRMGDATLGLKLANQIDAYIVDQLNYSYILYQKNDRNLNTRDVQLSLSLLNGMVNLTKAYKQDALSAKISAQLKDYGTKFGGMQTQK